MWKPLVLASIVVAIFLQLLYVPRASKEKKMQENVREVLAQDAYPLRYVLDVTPDLTNFTFSTSLVIEVDVRKATKSVSLNAEELELHTVAFEGGGVTRSATVEYVKETERVVLNFDGELPLGKGQIRINFKGTLNDKLKGFYRSKYTVNGKESFMACTQMEPVDCRRVLPCWDEPAVKAVFSVTLRVDRDLVALSNMPVIDEKEDGGLKVVKFADTPLMSSYLLAMIVGKLDFVEGKTKDGTLVRVYSAAGKGEQGRFALDVALKTLPFYNEYFGSPYPLPKYDMVAIADFAAGAMENWGLVTYRETALLVDEKNSSTSHKQWVALVVGHETAHQWFGNLVTMDWWESLWLNEGFASWVEYLCVDHCFPAWDIWKQFVYLDIGRALELDALASSHPVEVPVFKAADVDEIFDAISYSKGCAIIRMLQKWLGAEPFRKGLQQYLDHFKYKNAVTEDLWHWLGKSSPGKDVANVMTTWTKQTGYPVLVVTEEESPANEKVLKLTQKRFLQMGQESEETKNQLWKCPLSWVSGSAPHSPTDPIIVEKDTETIRIKVQKPDEWVKLNYDQSGLFRVLYPPSMLASLRKAIVEQSLSATDRLGLANDVLSLSQAGFLDASVALSFVQAYSGERDYTVWADLSSKISDYDVLISNTDFYPLFEAFNRHLYESVGADLGWDVKPGEAHTAPLLRSLVLNRLGKFGDAKTVQKAKEKFEGFKQKPDSLVPDLRVAVYATVLRSGGEKAQDELLNIYRTSELQEEKQRVLAVLGVAPTEELLKKTLAFAMSDEVRTQDRPTVICGVAANRVGRELCWNFIKENWAALTKMYEGGFLLSRLIKSASNFADEKHATDVEGFFKANPTPGVDRTVKQTVESIRLNAARLQKDKEKVHAWLKEHYGK